jgi:membrane-bound lytic murein transglycosylase A
VRADVFWGAGDEAEKRAGLMRENGRLWLLWPADLDPPAVVTRTSAP